MFILFFILANIIDFIILFRLNVNRKLILSPIIIIVTLVFFWGISMNILNVTWTNSLRNIGLSLILSSGVFTSMCFAKALVEPMLDALLSFHKKYNQKNLNRFPISFFFKYRNKIIISYHIIFFLGGIIMHYGVFFGMYIS